MAAARAMVNVNTRDAEPPSSAWAIFAIAICPLTDRPSKFLSIFAVRVEGRAHLGLRHPWFDEQFDELR